MLTDILEILWLVGILPAAFVWIFLQGFVKKRFLQKKSTSEPPVILGALTSFAWPLQLIFAVLYFGGRSAYSLGEGRGLHVNSVYDEAQEMIRARDKQLGEITALVQIGDVEGLRALINPDDALRAIAAAEREKHLNLDVEPEILPSTRPHPNQVEVPGFGRYPGDMLLDAIDVPNEGRF